MSGVSTLPPLPPGSLDRCRLAPTPLLTSTRGRTCLHCKRLCRACGEVRGGREARQPKWSFRTHLLVSSRSSRRSRCASRHRVARRRASPMVCNNEKNIGSRVRQVGLGGESRDFFLQISRPPFRLLALHRRLARVPTMLAVRFPRPGAPRSRPGGPRGAQRSFREMTSSGSRVGPDAGVLNKQGLQSRSKREMGKAEPGRTHARTDGRTHARTHGRTLLPLQSHLPRHALGQQGLLAVIRICPAPRLRPL